MANVFLGDKAVGDIVTIKENGVAQNYIIVQKGKPSSLYDDLCDGVWLLREKSHSNRVWHGTDPDTGVNIYENSDIKAWLNNEFLNSIDSKIRAAIKTVKIPFKKGTGNGGEAVQSGANGLSCKIFLLGGYEVGFTTSDSKYVPIDGARLAYFLNGDTDSMAKTKRICKDSGGSVVNWWLRSANAYDTNYAWGGEHERHDAQLQHVRKLRCAPCFDTSLFTLSGRGRQRVNEHPSQNYGRQKR